MVENRANLDYGRDDDPLNDLSGDRPATDSSEMTEGVGGTGGFDDEQRATVSDVDGDNVPADEERNPEASTFGSP